MKSSRRYSLVGKLLAMTLIVSAGAFTACNNSQGDTDGGSAVGNLDNGTDVPVSDGGFGASLTLTFQDDHIAVGETTGYIVHAADPQGLPLEFQRVFCESEKGIAILEPSSGGVGFEHTDANGNMSGSIGGLLPGSYIMECRIEQGFNLKVQKTVHIQGEIPDGFAGFPGASGGNLGGQVTIH